jgi:hypothetical protein
LLEEIKRLIKITAQNRLIMDKTFFVVFNLSF